MSELVGATSSDQTSRPGNRLWLFVAIVGVVLMALRTWFEETPPAIVPDSSGYLEWSPVRTPGYPIFLLIVRSVDPEMLTLPYLTMALLIGSCAFLAQAASRLGGARWIWGLMSVAILGNYYVWRYTWHVLSESLFMTMFMLMLGCIAMALRDRPGGLRWLMAASLLLGAAILVRPVGYALFGILLVLGVAWRGRRLAAIASLTLPALALILAASSWNLVQKGYFGTQIFGGFNILGQVSVLLTPETKADDPLSAAPIASISKGLEVVRAHLPWDIASWQLTYWMTSLAYNTAVYAYDLPAISDAVDRSFSDDAAESRSCYWCVPIPSAKRMNALGWSIAKAAIQQNPAGYAQLVLVNFAALWTVPAISSAETAAAFGEALHAEPLGPFYEKSDPLNVEIAIPDALVGPKTAAGFGLMLGSFALIIAVLLRRQSSGLLVFAAVAAISLNAHHLLIALVEAGIFRYAMVMWPCLFAMVAAMAALGSVALAERRSRKTAGDGAAKTIRG